MVASMDAGQGQQLGDLSCAKAMVAQSARRKAHAVVDDADGARRHHAPRTVARGP